MTTILKNVVTVQAQRGDVLSPEEYRTIVSGIRALIDQQNFPAFKKDYVKFIDHLGDFLNPHHEPHESLHDDFIAKVHEVYSLMTLYPLDFNQFKESVVPSLEYLELLTRISSNEYLYDLLKRPIGSVSRQTLLRYDPVTQTNQDRTISFSTTLRNKKDFIKAGWQSPDAYHVIDTAQELTSKITKLPLICAPDVTGEYYLNLPSHALTMTVEWGRIPSVPTLLFNLNGAQTFSVRLNINQSLTFISNGQVVLQTDPLLFTYAQIQISRDQLFVAVKDQIYSVNLTYPPSVPFDKLNLLVPVKPSAYSSQWGLRNLLVYLGAQYTYTANAIDLTTPEYFAYMQDTDGSPIVDVDGKLLFDYDVDVPTGHALLVDNDGDAFIDEEKNFIIVPLAASEQ